MVGWASRMTPGPLKSKKAYRTIGIPAFLAEELAAHLSAFPSSTDLVFSHESGGPLDYGRFRRRHWHPAVEVSVGEPCTPHDLRHTHVAMLIADGQSPRYIADRLGHTSTRTVLDVYGHLYEDADDARLWRVWKGCQRGSDGHQTNTRWFHWTAPRARTSADLILHLVGVDGLEPPTPAL